MTDHPYENEATQDERRAALKNDRLVRSTYFSHASYTDDEGLAGGRFSNFRGTSDVVAARPITDYPGAPNWAENPTGVEPPLNYDINAQEPVGTIPEILESVEQAFAKMPTQAEQGAVPHQAAPCSSAATINAEQDEAQPLPSLNVSPRPTSTKKSFRRV